MTEVQGADPLGLWHGRPGETDTVSDLTFLGKDINKKQEWVCCGRHCACLCLLPFLPPPKILRAGGGEGNWFLGNVTFAPQPRLLSSEVP